MSAAWLPIILMIVGGGWPLWAPIPAGLAYAAGLGGLGYAWQRKWRQLSGELRADETGLYIAGKRVVARDRLLHGHVHVDRGRTFLRLVRRAMAPRPIDIEVADESQANELLAALRLDMQTSVGEYQMLHGRNNRRIVGMIAGATGLISVFIGMMFMQLSPSPIQHLIGMVMWMITACGTAFAGMAAVAFVSVGRDGIFVRHRFMSRRFISFAEIRDVEQTDRDLVITLTNNTTIEMHHPRELIEGDSERRSLIDRIRTALTAYREAPRAPSVTNAQSETDASYRTSAVPAELLWRVVEDPAAPASERTAAATALKKELDDAGRSRLRIAAGASASAPLRVALETLAAEEDEDDAPAKRARLSR
jgi:hypothetical protein